MNDIERAIESLNRIKQELDAISNDLYGCNELVTEKYLDDSIRSIRKAILTLKENPTK